MKIYYFEKGRMPIFNRKRTFIENTVFLTLDIFVLVFWVFILLKRSLVVYQTHFPL